jgi:serine/threonine protein kinase
MLAQNLPGSVQPLAPPSPRLRLAHPVGTSLPAPHEELPQGTEFVGSSPAPPSQAHGISETAFAAKYFEKFFVVEKELGRGGRGVVLLVKHLLDGVTLGHFACKRVPIGDDHDWLEKVLVEVQALQALSHQNLVSYRHVWLEDYQINTFGPSVPCAFILQQYCNGGDLHNFVCGKAQATTTTQELKERIRRRSRGEADMPKRLDEPKKLHFDQIYSFFRDITAGLRFLHLHNFVHRDLKPSNCLLHTTGHETRVLVSDFGEIQYEYATRRSTGATGTISYCSPEVLQRISPDGPYGNFTFKSDIFSLGMILHFLCFANLPYRCADVLHEEREDIEELRAEIASWPGFDDQHKLRPDLPGKLYAFLKRLLSLDPDHRPTAEEVHHGIRTGGLEEPPELLRRNSGGPEEVTPGRRVQPIDSPDRRESSGVAAVERRGTNNASGSSRFLPSHLRQRQQSRDNSNIDEQVSGSQNDGVSNSGSAESSNILRRDIILRPKTTSSIPSPDQTQKPPTRPHSPLLLPPPLLPPPMRRRNLLAVLIAVPITSPILRVFILSLKLLTTLQPCAARSLGINPAVVYPLLTLAMAEMMLPTYQIWKALLGMVAHMVLLGFAGRMQTLCVVREDAWEHR